MGFWISIASTMLMWTSYMDVKRGSSEAVSCAYARSLILEDKYHVKEDGLIRAKIRVQKGGHVSFT